MQQHRDPHQLHHTHTGVFITQIREPLNKFRGSAAPGCAAIFQRPQVVGKWRQSKITLFDWRGLRSPGWTYSDLP